LALVGWIVQWIALLILVAVTAVVVPFVAAAAATAAPISSIIGMRHLMSDWFLQIISLGNVIVVSVVVADITQQVVNEINSNGFLSIFQIVCPKGHPTLPSNRCHCLISMLSFLVDPSLLRFTRQSFNSM
jgi:hypothetical protein